VPFPKVDSVGLPWLAMAVVRRREAFICLGSLYAPAVWALLSRWWKYSWPSICRDKLIR
jgi:hypothetical protein